MITICPHCQTPVKPSQDGETRCPGCGFLVLPQPGRICPNCHKYTLAAMDHCQHCQQPLPPPETDNQGNDPSPRQAMINWTKVFRAVIVILFSTLCLIGLHNYVEDRQLKQEALQLEKQTKAFAYHYTAFQKQFMKQFSMLFIPPEERQPLSSQQLFALQRHLQKTYIPQCKKLIQELDALPPQALELIINPGQVKNTLLEQLKLMHLMQDSLKQDIKTLTFDPAQPQIKI